MPSRSLRFPIVFLFFLTLQFSASHSAFGQGSKMKSEYEPVAEEDRDRPDLREEWMRNGRTAPPGQSAAALRLRAHQQKMTMRATRAAAAQVGLAQPAGAQTGWVSLGPAPLASQSGTSSNYGQVTGRATSVAIDASDQTGNTVYLGGAYGGVWKSTNAANASAASVTWTAVTDQQASLATGAVSVKPDGSVVLVGTGEPNSAIDSYYGVGILRSTDGGGTWALITSSDGGAHPFAGLGFSKFAWNTVTPGMVVAATGTTAKGFEEGDISNSTYRGLYLSTDSGQTWTYQGFVDGSLPISVTDVVFNSGAGKFFASVRYHGVYSSSNGTNWTRLANQPNPSALSAGACPTSPYSTSCPLYRGQLAAVPSRNEMYFWFVDGNISDQGIWRSVDGGNSWQQIPDSGITNCGDSVGCGVDQGYYNLEIAAVPNGSATDLYGGAVNLFKCTLNNTSSTSCSQGNWINLTHVYGCPNIANVHPDEHGLDFILASGAAVLYFANDGGIYRTLDGFTKLTSGSCGAPNGFDDLNGTMGSMAQFVSFSIHPTEKDIVLGGTQDNGSPATATATTNSAWQNANAGDGGYNAINPANPSQWFTENYGVSIQSCSAGTGCDFNGFVNNLVVDSTTLSGDLGAFYTPFILDPQNGNELLVGTCRVWRGATTAGSGYSTLSNNFDFTSGTCAGFNGNETDLVRSLGAGGQKDSNGFSKVVYATTEGVGPSSTSTPPGGEVWITTNAGTLAMSNVTGGINPSHYTISSVALDTGDTAGFTAYVGIMGFGGSHVWKTADAGASWTDWTGTGLPDAPVNSLLVDATAGTIYAGTDVGVFVSSTNSAGWTEVGPASLPGATGYLPNVPVSALRMFNSGGNKKLRVSTYGRGIWEYALANAPDFTNAISNSPQTVFLTQTATFNGTLTALNGYNNAVNLSCTGTAPVTCTLNPTQVTPTTGGATYTVTAGGAVGNYNFSAHGVGTDPNAITHDAAVFFQVADLTAPNPGTITAAQGLTSNASTFQVAGGAGFSGTIGLSCSGLPAGANCIFSPSNAVTPPQAVTLTVSTSGSTPQGNSTVTITAAAPGGAIKTQTFTLQVTAPPAADFTLNVTATPSATLVNQNVTWNGTLTAINSYNKSVSLSCTAGAPGTCMIQPASLVPTAGGAAFTVTAGSAAVATYNFSIQGTDGTLTHSQAVSLAVHDFTVPNPADPAAIHPGQKASVPLNISPAGSNTFDNSVSYSCTRMPAGAACAFLPPSPIAAGQLATQVQLTVSTAGPFSGTERKLYGEKQRSWLPLSVPLAGIVLAGLAGQRIPRRFQIAGLCLTLALTGLLAVCGGGGGSSTPAPITVSASPTPVNTLYPNLGGAPTQSVTLTASVSGTTNQAVTWAITANKTDDTVSSTGTATASYTAPSAVPAGAVTVTATSQADTAATGHATINIQTPTPSGTVTVTVTEGGLTHTATFNLTVN